ncbi:hypothetical protein [Luteitalea sp.]
MSLSQLAAVDPATSEIGRSSPRRDVAIRTAWAPALACFETVIDAPAGVLAQLEEGPEQYATADEARAWHAEWARRVEDALELSAAGV